MGKKPKIVSRERRIDHVTLAGELRAALANNELELQYQPIHDLTTRHVVSVEALLRWSDRADESASIDQLTSAAERGGEVFGLAEWVTSTAAKDMQDWPECDPPVRVNLNISSRHIQERNPIDFFRRVMAEFQLQPSRFNIEITEKSFIHKPKKVVGLLDDLKSLGFGLWLDDFGTGHSSIEHLKYFPVDGLKIPSTYVSGMLDDARSSAIVRAMISFAKALEIQVVAEGVERQEQLDFLIEHGCDEVQGYVFSHALAACDVAAYIKEKNS